jgi:hypothetical protein
MASPHKGQRRAIHAYISEDAHEALHYFAEENGISVTGLIEGIAQELTQELESAEPDEVRQPLVKLARRIDAANRRRG